MKHEIRTVELVYGEESVLPQLKLTNTDGRVVGFLSPFRGYCFQVSSTIDGEFDRGASTVVGLGNIVKAFQGYSSTSNYSIYSSNCSPVKGIFADMAQLALLKADIELGYMFTEIFDAFITATIEWIESLIK
jgi:hypothetical protein